MQKILLDIPGQKIILMGNEAIVRGALEAGIGFSSTYPGTPASEIGDTFAEIAKDAGIYFEYSTNEKVALEAAAGAALSGVRSLVSFKQFGLNVASDSVMPLAYVGTRAGMVIVVADDPSCWSSAQSEQDSRFYARLAHLPMLEPCSAQECKDFVKIAFEISEKFEIPVFVRTTTRVSHARGIVKLGKIVKGKTKGKFVKDLKKFNNLPPNTMRMHEELLKKIDKIKDYSRKMKLNFVVNNVKSKFGIITSGVSFDYVMDSLTDMKLKIPILRLGMTYPLDNEIIKNFIRKLKSILVVEELEPIIENEVNSIVKEVNPKLKIYGKQNGYVPKSGEYTEEIIIDALEKITKKKYNLNLKAHRKEYQKIKIARRFPLMCPGCQHRATFYAVKTVMGNDTVFGGDIGCYTLGILLPLETQDFIFSMGASEGLIHGIKKMSNQKAVAFIGDSTFFHAGIPALINMVYNKSNSFVIILDNRITAMTGHQPNPGMGKTGMGEDTKALSIEEIVKACGVDDVKVVDPFNLKEIMDAVKELMNKEGVSVLISKRECQLLAYRKKIKQGIKVVKFEIDQTKCKQAGVCLYKLACPALYKENGRFYINKNICTGCGVCVQVCPNKAIRAMIK